MDDIKTPFLSANFLSKQIAPGKDKDAEITKADGSKAKPFAFSGKLSTLPDLLLALERIRRSRVSLSMPAPDLLGKLPMDKTGVRDASIYSKVAFTPRIFKFGEYAAYTEWTSFMSASKILTPFHALTLTKKKTAEALRKSKNSLGFFLLQITVNSIDSLISCIKALLYQNNMSPLPLPAEGEEGGEDDGPTEPENFAAEETATRAFVRECNESLRRREGDQTRKDSPHRSPSPPAKRRKRLPSESSSESGKVTTADNGSDDEEIGTGVAKKISARLKTGEGQAKIGNAIDLGEKNGSTSSSSSDTSDSDSSSDMSRDDVVAEDKSVKRTKSFGKRESRKRLRYKNIAKKSRHNSPILSEDETPRSRRKKRRVI